MAYCMSALYLDGIKLGDQQLIMSGMTSAVLFMLMSHAKPLDTLAPGDDKWSDNGVENTERGY